MTLTQHLVVVSLALFCALVAPHPAIQHNFNKLINADKCLKECMQIVTEPGRELSVLKRANLTDYFGQLDEVCATIDSARECFAKCNASNPFALPSVTTLCQKDVKLQVLLLRQCLQTQGATVFETCRQTCGDYDRTNDEVYEMTMRMAANPNHPERAAEVMEKTGVACEQLKCSYRCQVADFNDNCSPLFNGHKPGDLLMDLLNRVLVAQRVDLDRHGLTDVVAHQVPDQCSYMYIPEVMFDEQKDRLSHAVVDELKQAFFDHVHNKQHAEPSPLALKDVHDHMHETIQYTAAQAELRILQRQFHNLLEHEKNIQKESHKLDLEIEVLEKRKKMLGF